MSCRNSAMGTIGVNHPEAGGFDILPSLKEGDSYGAGHKSELRTQSLRWVPAAGGITAPLT